MWGTFILDAFRQSQAREVRDALEALLGPNSGSAWSSGGAYLFWDPGSREPLYVGISGDLPLRFAQHLGLRSAPRKGCKRGEIEDYFAAGNEWLGYTVIALSSLSQVSTARQRASLALEDRDLTELNEALSAEAMDQTRALEGRLIASNQISFGRLPRWNDSPGRRPREVPVVGDATLMTAVGAVDILLQARKTIRQLAADDVAQFFEEHLHAVRMLSVAAANRGGAIDNAALRRDLDEFPASEWLRDEILSRGYLDRRCSVTIGPSVERLE
jgi:hypothetical protein